MLILTESNNPFKQEFHVPRVLQESMNEVGVTIEMFEEEYKWCGNNLSMYMYAMLYEAEQAFNEIYSEFLTESAYAYLNEADPAGAANAAAQNAQQKSKGFWAKITGGVQTFFKKFWEYANGAIRKKKLDTAEVELNNPAIQKKVLKASKSYNDAEIAEWEKMRTEFLNVVDAQTKQAQTTTDPAFHDMAMKNIEQARDLYEKRKQEFEDRHLKRVQAVVMGQELQRTIKKVKSKTPEKIMQREQELTNRAIEAGTKAASTPAAPAAQANNGQNAPTASPAAQANNGQNAPAQQQQNAAGNQMATSQFFQKIVSLISAACAKDSAFIQQITDAALNDLNALKGGGDQGNDQNANAQQPAQQQPAPATA